MAFSGCTSSYFKDSGNESEAAPVEFERIVEFDRDVHFLSQEGTSIVVPAGEYSVDSVQDGLRLKSADNDEREVVIVPAELGTHDRSVEAPEPLFMSGGDDQPVVMLLLPEGKSLQAVGSYSGVFPRHPHPPKIKPGAFSGLKLPRVQSILATPAPPPYDLPPPGNITPFGTLYIKGELFGPSQGKVMLHVQVPVDGHFYVPKGTMNLPGTKAGTRRVQLEVERWSQDRITVKMPLVSGVPDHSAVLQILDAKGLGSLGWKVPFYATRARTTLQLGENVTSHKCITPNDDKGGCLDQPYANPIGLNKDCFHTAKLHKDKTITAYHVNCDSIVDWDKGSDQYTIELKNNWVIEAIRWGWSPHSTSEKLKLPSADALTQKYKGGSKMTLFVPWEVSPGPDWLSYWIDIDVKGPAGVLYGDRVYWKK
jgi:hypothetical protein